MKRYLYKSAFTLAEVLITLGIIGVVAALTMPSLIANYEKKQTVTKLKKVYTILYQAYKQSENDNGFSEDWIDDSVPVSKEAVKDYVYKYWIKYFNVAKECPDASACKYNQAIAFDGSKLALVGVNRYTIVLNDGTIIAFVPFSSTPELGQFWGVSQKFYVSINKNKKINRTGKDFFIFELNLKTHSLTACGQNLTQEQINSSCNRRGNGMYCAAKIINDGWEIKDDYPW